MSKKEEFKRFTISLPKELYDKFESYRQEHNLSRSEGIRKAMNAYMVDEDIINATSGNVVGCISMIMSHEHIIRKNSQPALEHSLEIDHDHEYHDHDIDSRPTYAGVHQSDELLKNDIQHHFHDIILSTLHVHLEFEKCLEILAVSGPIDRVNRLKDDLHQLRSVISLKSFIVDKEI